ncbi:hemoblobin-interacting domain-containing protein [Paenibacillus donghaensis]|uniref:Heme-binding protein Shr-like Hb-interacting domain-containing protein n=1 Tax=Paenibacillus donghaensis TaxID=414771 RepID=A0A2Z2KT67_9BACL|nr:hypothetical protein [Paenibacillus donghaensis]ASA24942.1 hypothetical protein B9T62_31815 [Paenibacillus donghaensis]
MATVSKMMAIVITAVTVLTVSPSESHAASPIAPLTSATAEVGSDNTAVTVTFNTYTNPTASLADLMSNIQIERSGSNAFVDLSTDHGNNTISRTADGALVLTLHTALTGTTNAINVKAGSIMNKDEVPSANDITISGISAHDITPPAYVGSSSSNGNQVNLNFDEDFTINAPDGATQDQVNAYLKSKLSVAVDGEHFVPVTEQEGDIYQNGSRQIYLNYHNDMKVILGARTLVQVAAGTLKDAAGNLNEDMILHVSPPTIQSATVSSDNHEVILTFYGDVLDLTNNSLGNYIRLYKGTGNWKSLVTGDAASIVDGKLHIHFAEALAGTTNQIMIDRRALKDTYGNVQNDVVLTALLPANIGGVDPSPADTTPPTYLYSYLSNSVQDLNLVFDEDVENARADVASFLQGVQWYDSVIGSWRYSLPSDITLTFAGPLVTIHFAAPLTGNQYLFEFDSNHFKDTAGNAVNNSVGTNWFFPQRQGISYSEGYFSHDGRQLSLGFNNNNSNLSLVDQTLVDGVSQLKEHITLSTDYGVTYAPLDEQDVVSVSGNRINIFFHEAKQVGSVKVRVDAGVVSDSYDTIRNVAVDAVVAYNTPEITGYFLSNTASEFVFADNAAWRNRVQAVRIYENNVGTERVLNSSEYSLSEGKLTVTNGVFQKGHYYRISVDAAGYSSRNFEGRAYVSSEIFYITAPVVTAENGITAKINLFNNVDTDNNNYSIGNQVVLFELFDGSTPVSIVAANLKLNTGTYSANFNVMDGATNPNYTVRAYVVSKYSSDSTNLGLNLATVKTQLELDQANSSNDNNNEE